MADQSPPESTLKVIVIDSPTIKNQEKPPSKQPSIITTIYAGYFRICISLGGQALLWQTLSEQTNISFKLHNGFAKLPSTTYILLWSVALFVLVLLSLLYILRCIFHFNMVKAEFSHHVGVNYQFAPWISWLLLLQSAPLSIFPNKYSYQHVGWLLIVPLVALDVKVYGQWFTTEKRFLSMVANPTSQMSVIGNLVGAHAAVQMGWRESGICLFTLGMIHYLVVFITLYQRLSGSNHLPAGLRPVFFQFVATPSIATLAWKSVSGNFDILCKMLFFLSLFLFASLVTRPALFKKPMKRFSVAWWAFSFPLTFLALASTAYAQQVKAMAAIGLALVLSALSVLVFFVLLVYSTVNIDSLLHKPILSFSTDNNVGSTNV